MWAVSWKSACTPDELCAIIAVGLDAARGTRGSASSRSVPGDLLTCAVLSSWDVARLDSVSKEPFVLWVSLIKTSLVTVDVHVCADVEVETESFTLTAEGTTPRAPAGSAETGLTMVCEAPKSASSTALFRAADRLGCLSSGVCGGVAMCDRRVRIPRGTNMPGVLGRCL